MKPRLLANPKGIFLFYHLLVFYIGWNGWVWLNTMVKAPNLYFYAIIITIISYSYFLSRFGPRYSAFRIIGFYWLAVVQYAIILLPIVDAAVLLAYVGMMPVETGIYWAGFLTLTGFAAFFAYGSFNAKSPVIRQYKIELPKQAGRYHTLRIAMASDMHFGTLSGKAHLKRLVERVNSIQPDLVLFPGDIIDDDPEPFTRKNMRELMKQLKAPLGVYGVLGNHEYYGGKIPEFLKEMEASGVRILLDEAVQIEESFYLIGRKDRIEKNRLALEQLVAGLDQSKPLIMMDHQPYELSRAALNGIDVMLSGHTHRGQMAPNHLITKKLYEIDWGYLKKNELHVIVSSGFGFWGPPLRIGSRSEIVQIDITFK